MEWPQFYMGLANAMKDISGSTLYEKVKELSQGNPAMNYLHFANTAFWEQRGYAIDPFTVLGIFNRGQTDTHRATLARQIGDMLGVTLAPPNCYHGIPHLDPRKSIYDGQAEMQALFEAALNGATPAFTQAWDDAIAVHGNGLGTLSIGLFWIRPYDFMAIDRISDPLIRQEFGLPSPSEKCSGAVYCEYLAALTKASQKAGLSFPQLAYEAWRKQHPDGQCP